MLHGFLASWYLPEEKPWTGGGMGGVIVETMHHA